MQGQVVILRLIYLRLIYPPALRMAGGWLLVLESQLSPMGLYALPRAVRGRSNCVTFQP